MKRKVMLACGLVCGAVPALPGVSTAWAVPISLVTPNVAYTQDFNTLGAAGDNTTLFANTTLPTGWEFVEALGNANTTYRSGSGNNNAGDTWSYGTGTNMDRALGALASGSLTSQFGAVFTNNTGQTITSLKVDYTGEQWRRGDSAANVLTFAYNENAAAINSGVFTPFGTLDFTAPIAVAPNNSALDGNAAANRTAKSATIGGLNIPVGQSFAIRWSDANDGGTDDGLGVDDFSLTPNPSTGPLPSPFSIKLPDANQKITVDFTGFTGAGFTPTPGATQLDSDNWRATGFSDGDGAFGGTHLAGDFARGSDNGGVTTGGVYAFDHGGGDVGLGVQPAGSEFNPGTFELKLPNETGAVINDVSIMYDIWVFNDQGRANSLNFSWSTDGTTFTNVPLLDFVSGEAALPVPVWASFARSVSLSALGIPDGGFLYLRWTGADVSGTGSRDEFAIDNIMVSRVTAVPEPATLMLLGLLAPAALRRRARR